MYIVEISVIMVGLVSRCLIIGSIFLEDKSNGSGEVIQILSFAADK